MAPRDAADIFPPENVNSNRKSRFVFNTETK